MHVDLKWWVATGLALVTVAPFISDEMRILAGLVGFAILFVSAIIALIRFLRRLSTPKAPAITPTIVPERAGLPAYNTDARTALVYAATRVWGARLSASARDLQRVMDVLERFYDLARNKDVRVWGRKSLSAPLRPVDCEHWENWEIRHPDVFENKSSAEPLRTVPRWNNLVGSPEFDLHLSKAEIEAVWPPDRLLGLASAAALCFEETLLAHDIDVGEAGHIRHQITIMVMEAQKKPEHITLWGYKPPATKPIRIPPVELSPFRTIYDPCRDRVDIQSEYRYGGTAWDNLCVSELEIREHIERLKRGEAQGQLPPDDKA
jgi:hypothetical protein